MIKQIIISILALLILDGIYIGLVSKLYYKQIRQIQGSPMVIKPLGVVLCYGLLIFGLYYFIIRQKKSPGDAFILGLVIYGVFDSTNYALIRKWNGTLSLIDTLWGGILFALTTWLTYKIIPNIIQ